MVCRVAGTAGLGPSHAAKVAVDGFTRFSLPRLPRPADATSQSSWAVSRPIGPARPSSCVTGMPLTACVQNCAWHVPLRFPAFYRIHAIDFSFPGNPNEFACNSGWALQEWGCCWRQPAHRHAPGAMRGEGNDGAGDAGRVDSTLLRRKRTALRIEPETRPECSTSRRFLPDGRLAFRRLEYRRYYRTRCQCEVDDLPALAGPTKHN